jgi:hypothetical protein
MSTRRFEEDTSADLQESKLELAKAEGELAQAKVDLERQKYLGVIYLKARSKGRVLKQCDANEQGIMELRMPVGVFLEAVKTRR